jgi:hypothetical protein
MNNLRSVLAVLALALGATAVASTAAYARDPDREIPLERSVAVVPGPPNYPQYALSDPAAPAAVSSSSAGVDVMENGASALGGAAVACGVMWLYRRRVRLAG